MKGLCIDNVSTFVAPLASITVGRWYDISDDVSLSSYFWICDDNGFNMVSLRSNFKYMEDVRDERLKLLGIVCNNLSEIV
jgi:hypothetical protein